MSRGPALPICHVYTAAKQWKGKLGAIPVPIAQTNNLFFLLSPFATKQNEGPFLLFPPIPLPPQRPFMEQVLSLYLSLATGLFPGVELDARIASAASKLYVAITFL